MYLSPLLLVCLVLGIVALVRIAYRAGRNTGWYDGLERGREEIRDDLLEDREPSWVVKAGRRT